MTEDPTTALASNPQLTEFMQTLNSQLKLYLPIAIGLSLVITLLLVINIVQKLRVNAAILRMDKNIKKLVDGQLLPDTHTHDTPVTQTVQVPDLLDPKQFEQK